jgi:hypothetical protein
MPFMAKASDGIFCRSCGYDLRSLSKNRCPECGREFDPGERRTYDLKPRRTTLTRWIWRISIVTFLTLITAAALITQTWRGWNHDQQAYDRLKHYGIVRKELAPMPVVEHLLPEHFQYLRTRVWSVCLGCRNLNSGDWDAMQQMEYLREGRFGSLPSAESLRRVEALHGLTELHIGGLNVNDELLLHLPQTMPRLQGLWLSGNTVTDAGIAALAKSKSLQELRLFNSNISDIGLMSLAQIPSLKSVAIGQKSEVTDEGIQLFNAVRPDVNVRKLAN